MADLSELLSALEAFADDAVIIREGSGTPATSLTEKLDVLERVVELLRLHTGTPTIAASAPPDERRPIRS